MANTKSAEKRMRQARVRGEANRAYRSKMRTAVKRLRQAIARGDGKEARDLLAETLSVIDATASKDVIHRNTAARTKSRLTRAVQGLEG